MTHGVFLRFALCALRVSSLPLLVLGIVANNHHLAFAADDFAFIANFFNRGTNFHVKPRWNSL